MKEKKAIKAQIKKKYGTIEEFCEVHDYRYTDFGSKLKTAENKINWLNEFLEPLNFGIEIVMRF